MTIVAAAGNTLVIVAIIKVPTLRTVSNLFVLSLAITDFLVAILILPFSLQSLYLKHWYLGEAVCILWICVDVLLVTASILNICAISVDRYRAIEQPVKYSLRRTPALAAKVISAVWVLSAVVSLPAAFVIDFSNVNNSCGLQRNTAFTICSSFVSFYGPLIVVLFVYAKLYRAARKRANRVGGNGAALSTTESSDDAKPQLQRQTTLQRLKSTFSRANLFNPSRIPEGSEQSGNGRSIIRSTRISAARERKAARTIAIIVGVFTVCWLPFFTMHVTLSLCRSCHVSERTYNIVSWIGYWNSSLNPVIYTLFNKDFRTAFAKLLRCKLQH